MKHFTNLRGLPPSVNERTQQSGEGFGRQRLGSQIGAYTRLGESRFDPRRLPTGKLAQPTQEQILRGLREFTGWEAAKVEATLAEAGVRADLRPEALAPEAFARLLRALVDGGWQPA